MLGASIERAQEVTVTARSIRVLTEPPNYRRQMSW